jgi:hypothetical protein
MLHRSIMSNTIHIRTGLLKSRQRHDNSSFMTLNVKKLNSVNEASWFVLCPTLKHEKQ